MARNLASEFGADFHDCCAKLDSVLDGSIARLRAAQRMMADFKTDCDDSKIRSEETVELVDRFQALEPEDFLKEVREKVREMMLDSSRGRHREELERLLQLTY